MTTLENGTSYNEWCSEQCFDIQETMQRNHP